VPFPLQALSAMPYIETGVLIEPFTSVLSYLGLHLDSNVFENRREMMYDDLASPSATRCNAPLALVSLFLNAT
jgi:hypothetical protein